LVLQQAENEAQLARFTMDTRGVRANGARRVVELKRLRKPAHS